MKINRLLVLLSVLLVSLSFSCNDEKATPFEETEDMRPLLQGVWRGNIPAFHVDGGNTRPNYTLNDLRGVLILEEQTYWFEATYYSDTRDFAYVQQGYWNWFEALPDNIFFEATKLKSTQVFKQVVGDSTIELDRIVDDFEMTGDDYLASWAAYFEIKGDSLKLIDFGGDLQGTLSGADLER